MECNSGLGATYLEALLIFKINNTVTCAVKNISLTSPEINPQANLFFVSPHEGTSSFKNLRRHHLPAIAADNSNNGTIVAVSNAPRKFDLKQESSYGPGWWGSMRKFANAEMIESFLLCSCEL